MMKKVAVFVSKQQVIAAQTFMEHAAKMGFDVHFIVHEDICREVVTGAFKGKVITAVEFKDHQAKYAKEFDGALVLLDNTIMTRSRYLAAASAVAFMTGLAKLDFLKDGGSFAFLELQDGEKEEYGLHDFKREALRDVQTILKNKNRDLSLSFYRTTYKALPLMIKQIEIKLIGGRDIAPGIYSDWNAGRK